MSGQAVGAVTDIPNVVSDGWKVLRNPNVRRVVPFYMAAAILLMVAGVALNPPTGVVAMIALVLVGYAPVEYLLHRYVLHSLHYLTPRFLARMWIRVHYAHHRRPAQQDVILASPPMVVFLVVVLSVPIYFVFSPVMVLPFAATIFALFSLYEIVHFSAHTGTEMVSGYFRHRRKMHLLHHYHEDRANFGILTSIIDRLVGTYQTRRREMRSPTAFNLGYFGDLVRRKPLVRQEYKLQYPDVPDEAEAMPDGDA